MLEHSFTFGGVDMREKFGVWMVAYDTFLPPLRSHKTIVPGRSGAYDFGSEEYDERTVRLQCDTRTGISRGRMREIAYMLSKKNELRLWTEPDKFYVGRIYDPPELEDLGQIVYKFSLTFLCEPFAYTEPRVVTPPAALWNAEYAGTAKTPTRIEIVNTGETTAVGIKLTATERRESY